MWFDAHAKLAEIKGHPPATSATSATQAQAAPPVSQKSQVSQASGAELHLFDLDRWRREASDVTNPDTWK